MSKFSAIIFAIFIFALGRSQVAPDRTVVQELFFSGQKWYIAANFYNTPVKNGDTVRMITSSGFSVIKPELKIEGKVVILTSDNFKTPIVINREGDLIKFEKLDAGIWKRIGWTIYFGNHPDASVNSPEVGQSLVSSITGYSLIVYKSNEPALGSKSVGAQNNASLSGTIMKDNVPLTGAVVACVQNACNKKELALEYPDVKPYTTITAAVDDFGNYQFGNLLGMNYELKVYYGDSVYIIPVVSTEPGTVTDNPIDLKNVKIVEEGTSVSLANINAALSVSPNPVSENTRISVAGVKGERIVVKISNLTGCVLETIDLTSYKGLQEISTFWNASSLPSGTYIVTLMADNTVVAGTQVIKQ